MASSDTIPARAQLIEQIQRANRVAGPWVVIQFLALIALAWGIDWSQIVEEPLFSMIAVLVILGPHVMDVLRQYAGWRRAHLRRIGGEEQEPHERDRTRDDHPHDGARRERIVARRKRGVSHRGAPRSRGGTGSSSRRARILVRSVANESAIRRHGPHASR